MSFFLAKTSRNVMKCTGHYRVLTLDAGIDPIGANGFGLPEG
jgi:hypothetical protein